MGASKTVANAGPNDRSYVITNLVVRHGVSEAPPGNEEHDQTDRKRHCRVECLAPKI
jgi:hypothetical protein